MTEPGPPPNATEQDSAGKAPEYLETEAGEIATRNRLLLESWAQAIWETDAEGVVVTDSPSWRAYTGQTLEEWLGYGWLDAIHPEDREYAERQWCEAMAAGNSVNAEFRLRSPDGGYRWTNVRAAPVLASDKSIEKWAGMNIDIDAHKRAEAELRASEMKYRTLFEAIDKGFCILELVQENGHGVDFRIVEGDQAAEAQGGLLNPAGKLGTEMAPGDERPWLDIYDRIARTGKAERFERYHDSTGRWYDVNVKRVEGANPPRLAIVFNDVTDQRRAEQALRESEERQRFLLELGDAVRAQPDVTGKIEVAARLLGERLQASRVLWGEYDWQENVAHIFNGWFADGAQPFPTVMQLADYEGEVLRDLRAGQTVRVDDVGAFADTPGHAAIAQVGVQALLSPPLIVGGELKVNLSIHQHEPRHWTDDEVSLVQDVAERLWAEVERARAETALRDREQKYRTLFDSIDEGLAIVEMIYDERGEVIDMVFRQVNAAYEQQGGLSDVVGRSVLEVLPGMERVWLDRYKQVAASGEALRVEGYQQDVDRWFEVYFSRVDTDGRYVATVFKNITDRKRAEQGLREDQERQKFLLTLSDRLRSEADPSDIAATSVKMLAEQLRLDRAYVAEVSKDEDVARVGPEYRRPDLAPVRGEFKLSDFPEAFSIVETSTLILTDAANDPSLSESDRQGFAALRMGALMVASAREGTANPTWSILVASEAPRQWTPVEVSILEEATERTWAAIERARAQAALRESEEHQSFLLTLSDALHAEPTADRVVMRALEELVAALQLDRCYVGVYRLDDDWAQFPYQTGGDQVPPLPAGVPLSNFPEALRMARVRTLVVDNAEEMEGLSDLDRQSILGLGMRAFVAASARKGGNTPDWAIVAVSAARRAWTSGEIALIEQVTERTWIAMERARIDTALRESEERLSLAIQVGQFASWTWDLSSGEVAWNDRHYLVQGYAVDEVEPSFEAWLAGVHPDDRDDAVAAIERARDAKTPYAHDFRTQHPDGTVRWCAARGRFFYDAAGAPYRMTGVMEDVTDRVQADAALRDSEDRLRLIVENAREYAIFTIDLDGRCTDWLEGAEAVFGYAKDEIIGQDADVLFTPEDREKGAPDNERAIASREGKAQDVRWHMRKDGSRVFIDGVSTALRDADNRVIGFLKIGHDVTERHASERRQQLLLEELQHRVRNILAMIRSMVRQSVNSYDNLEEFSAHLAGRLDAMARTQVLLTRAAEVKVDLESLIWDEFESQIADERRVNVAGPKVALSPKAAEVLTLALHELATNSVKYGALMEEFGRVSVTWGVAPLNGQDWLQITWEESCRSTEPTTIRRGFGTELIEGRVPYELNGEASLYLTGGGVKADIAFPLSKGASILETGPAVEAGGG